MADISALGRMMRVITANENPASNPCPRLYGLTPNSLAVSLSYVTYRKASFPSQLFCAGLCREISYLLRHQPFCKPKTAWETKQAQTPGTALNEKPGLVQVVCGGPAILGVIFPIRSSGGKGSKAPEPNGRKQFMTADKSTSRVLRRTHQTGLSSYEQKRILNSRLQS